VANERDREIQPRRLQPQRAGETPEPRSTNPILRSQRMEPSEPPVSSARSKPVQTNTAHTPSKPIDRRSLLIALGVGVLAVAIVPRVLRSGTPTLESAVASGKVRADIIAFKAAGDLEMFLAKASPDGPDVELSVPLGTTLFSLRSDKQTLIVSGLAGRTAVPGKGALVPTVSVGSSPVPVQLEAYCTEFEKGAPDASTPFRIQSPDPVLACILEKASSLSLPPPTTQAAVWIHTDHMTLERINRWGSTSAEDFARAADVTSQCAPSR
jgi:hypothetical protein